MARRQAGIAQPFYLRCDRERVARGLTKTQLESISGITRSTFENIATSTRPPLARIVHALADALDIPRSEAEELSGLVPPKPIPGVRVRDAVAGSTTYTDDQKRVLLDLIDMFDRDAARRSVVDQPGRDAQAL